MNRPIVMYIGGFAKTGGIEAFVRDFLLAVAPRYPQRELVMWGGTWDDHPLLREIAGSGAKIVRSAWRWGCRWRLPDYVLAWTGAGVVRRAGVVIFKRPPPIRILRFLRRAALAGETKVPFVIIMPYRPAEYWGDPPRREELDYFDAVVVQSEDGADDFRRAGFTGIIAKIPLLPPVQGQLADFPSWKSETIRLGFLGRLAAQKNLNYLLEIYHVLTTELDPARRYELHLFGDGEQRAELEEWCSGMAAKNVFFHGAVPRAEVGSVIDSCDVFLNTSTTEGQCIAALEILGRGRPLVATPVGALPEVLMDPALGRLAPLGDPKSFAGVVSAVAQAVRDRTMTPQSVAEAFGRRYNHDAVAAQYVELLERVVVKE